MWRLWCATCGWAEPGDSACRHQRQVITVAPDLDRDALAMALELANEMFGCVENYDINRHELVSEWLRRTVTAELLDRDRWRVR